MDGMECDNCGSTMRWETSHSRCDRCGYIRPCCEGAPVTASCVVPATRLQTRLSRPRRYAAWPTCWASSSTMLTSRTPRVTGGSQLRSMTSSRSASVTVRR